jgi:hypothetical protein
MRLLRFKLFAIALASFVTLLVQDAAADVGQIKTVSGEVLLIRNAIQQPARAGDLVQKGDALVTGANASAGITFVDNSRFSIGPNTRIEIAEFRFDATTHEGEFLTRIERGTLVIVSGHIAKQSVEAMKVRTPTTVITVRGTTFAVKVQD